MQRLQKRQAMQRIAALASVGNGRWHEGAGSSGVYGTQIIGGGGSSGAGRSNTNVIGGFESDTDKARRERMEKQQMQQQQAQEQAQRAADVAQLAASMKENENANLNDNPEVAETIMADMSGSWEVPTPEEVENMQIDESELPEDFVEEEEAAEKSTGTVTGEWAVGQDHRNKQAKSPESGAAPTVDTPSSPSASTGTSGKPKSQGTVTGEWAVGADHKLKQRRRPPSGGRGFES